MCPAAENVTVNLLVTSGNVGHGLAHHPASAAIATQYLDLSAHRRRAHARRRNRVSIRTVSNPDRTFWPTTPITITAATTGPTQWPVALGNAVNAMNGSVRVGVLNAQNQVVPAANATATAFAMTSAGIASAFRRWSGRGTAGADESRGLLGNAQVSLTWNAVSGATGYNRSARRPAAVRPRQRGPTSRPTRS
jgi:hypothetical protein